MAKIKLRKVVRNVKLFDRSKNLAKSTSSTMKQTADRQSTGEEAKPSPTAYATDCSTRPVANCSKKAIHTARKPVRNVRRACRSTSQVKSAAREAKEAYAKLLPRKKAAAKKANAATSKAVRGAPCKTIKTAKATNKTAKIAKRTCKSIKTVSSGTKAVSANTKSAKALAQSKKIAKITAVKTKQLAIALKATIKLTIAAVKSTTAIVIACGSIVVMLIVIITMIAAIAGSPMGIFASGSRGNSGDDFDEYGYCIMEVVQELTTEFYEQIDVISAQHHHDELEVGAMSLRWHEILAVFAVATTMCEYNPMDVAFIDDVRVTIIRVILNETASLSHDTRTETRQRPIERNDEYVADQDSAADGDENASPEYEEYTVTILRIILNHRTPDEMATLLNFNADQREQLQDLLDPEYAYMWAELLGGYVPNSGLILIPDDSRNPTGIFTWPMGAGFRVSSQFGHRDDPLTSERRFHSGIDIAAPGGTPILAMADGVVVAVNGVDSWAGGWGFYIQIRHCYTYTTFYAHCSRIAVFVGQEVVQGQVIGYVGTTGRSTGNHLHFEVWRNGSAVNPIGWFG